MSTKVKNNSISRFFLKIENWTSEMWTIEFSSPFDGQDIIFKIPEVEIKEVVLETKIIELKETTKEEVATNTLEEEIVANIMPLEKSKENPKDVYLWGVPLLDTKGDESSNVILLKFLRAKDFNVDEACTMLVNTVKWR